jgi:hypothetical protein
MDNIVKSLTNIVAALLFIGFEHPITSRENH